MPRLGDVLTQEGVLEGWQLGAALAHQRQFGGRLGRVLVELKFLSEDTIADVLGRQLGLPALRLSLDDVDPDALRLVPQEICERHGLVPYAFAGEALQVAMVDPTLAGAVDEVRAAAGRQVLVVVSPESRVEDVLRWFFHGEPPPERGQPDSSVDVAPGDPLRSFFFHEDHGVEPDLSARQSLFAPPPASLEESTGPRTDHVLPATPPERVLTPGPAAPVPEERRLLPGERMFLDTLFAMAEGRPVARPIPQAQLVAALARLLIEKGVIKDHELVEELSRR